MTANNTAGKPRGRPFEIGNQANPAGRPKGARNKLSEAFAEALHADFVANGTEAIERMRVEEPAQYVRTIASLLPKEMKIESAPLADLPDDELARLVDILRAASAPAAQPGSRTH